MLNKLEVTCHLVKFGDYPNCFWEYVIASMIIIMEYMEKVFCLVLTFIIWREWHDEFVKDVIAISVCGDGP